MLVTTAGADHLARLAIFMATTPIGPEPANELLDHWGGDLLYRAILAGIRIIFQFESIPPPSDHRLARYTV